MPRLFTGLEIPAVVGTQVGLLRGGLRNARWIDPENYHITLRFIGDIDDRTADEIADALMRVRRASVRVHISGLGSFGGDKPHTLFARVAPSTALGELQAEHERILQRLGLPPEGRKFTPHITLARLRGTSPREVADWLALRGGFEVPPFIAPRFVLFSARASVGGGPYLVEEAFPLAV
ncbi:2'-5' RNA ligase [Pseudoxanthobacter soli DSM 19599]|uniref:RNA 2',3'-cyclic phosphodiesterase n=1 Tax=Pseudoxanthobacter soli DSM 19599 TaxID=1123029 RepID=A0A1M7ZKC5_9HYPH|nr:RNA 2',3'-cyclic phosphodiesterase [Pseudoxanthobacter soli]SHO65262.1 2'-5' RNA ligase [Pseudoxanthobacter soli DSM 19599]